MQRFRQTCRVLALICLLAPAAWADDGIMHPELLPPPPPPPPPTVNGIMHPEEAVEAANTSLDDAALQFALDLVNLLAQL
ncbi:MAG TPA: hypothetical protein VF546_04790 [Pyrinomonadaceae bacterium]|jgi:hypothetical protein